MSKKHFIKAAKFIRSLVEDQRFAEAKTCYKLIIQISDNSNFSVYRFKEACGLQDI
jgi:hypothetical protein